MQLLPAPDRMVAYLTVINYTVYPLHISIPPSLVTMSSVLLRFVVLSLFASAYALVTHERRASVAYTAPTASGGSQLDSSAGLGEPLNVSDDQTLSSLIQLLILTL